MSRADAHAVAANQHGLITADQARENGLSLKQARYLVDTGIWERLARDVYRVVGAPRTYESDVLAACFAGGPLAVASGATVARLAGVGRPYYDRAGIEITVPRGVSPRGARALGATVRTVRNLGPGDRRRIGAIPVTASARLIVDLLGDPPEHRDAVADDLLFRKRCSPDDVRLAAARAGRTRRRQLDTVLDPWRPGPRPGSPKEMSLLRVLLIHGLPRPERQYHVRVNGRSRFLDLAYPDRKLTPEYDGRRDHGPRDWRADGEREDELTALGWIRLPAGRLDIREPWATEYCNMVRAAIEANWELASTRR
jgi:hypothetical protein